MNSLYLLEGGPGSGRRKGSKNKKSSGTKSSTGRPIGGGRSQHSFGGGRKVRGVWQIGRDGNMYRADKPKKYNSYKAHVRYMAKKGIKVNY